jgi:kynureninase
MESPQDAGRGEALALDAADPLAPLTTRFVDVWDAVAALESLLR